MYINGRTGKFYAATSSCSSNNKNNFSLKLFILAVSNVVHFYLQFDQFAPPNLNINLTMTKEFSFSSVLLLLTVSTRLEKRFFFLAGK